MQDPDRVHQLPVLETLGDGRSQWATTQWPSETRSGMQLSPRIDCSSLRLRRSEPGYFADWHVAGEAVLIVIQHGTLRIGLRNGETRDFSEGQAFIAADRVPEGRPFDPALHGHTARVIGESTLQAIHIKLSNFPT
jgi:hypothetical protein